MRDAAASLRAIARACPAELRGWIAGRAIEGRAAFEGEDAALLRRAAELGLGGIALHPGPSWWPR